MIYLVVSLYLIFETLASTGNLGFTHSCLHRNQNLYCFGSNDAGQFGVDDPSFSSSPLIIPSISNVKKVSSGQSHTCVLTTYNEVLCFGSNHNGALGIGHVGGTQSTPISIIDGNDIEDISGSNLHYCAVKKNGKVICWGLNTIGQCGDGSSGNIKPSPVEVASIYSAKKISVNYMSSCAVLEDGSVKCWGSGYSKSEPSGLKPVTISGFPSPPNIIGISSNGFYHCAIRSNGDVYCWGSFVETTGMAGAIGVQRTNVAVKVPGLENIISLAAGSLHLCALNQQGSVLCFGDNHYGQIGNNNSPNDQVSPMVIIPFGVVSISSGSYQTCAIFDDDVRCWGQNLNGQLGIEPISNFGDQVLQAEFPTKIMFADAK